MSLLDTGVSLPNPRPSLRAQGSDRRHFHNVEHLKMREAGGSGNPKITVDVKDDDDEVQILSPRSVAQAARISRRKRCRAASVTTNHMDLELTLGSSASVSQKASARVSKNAIIDLTSGNDDDVIPLASAKRKAPRLSPPPPPPEPSKNFQLTCAICMDTMKEETSTVCGHIFCRPCILGAIKTQKKCPSCRRKLTNSSIHRIYLSNGSS
eukprot:c32951_g1_i1 orf=285-914(+)